MREGLTPGALINERFLLGGLLGQGGQAEVYRAVDVTTQMEVALKVLRQDLRFPPRAAERLEREGRVLAKVEHPALARIIDAQFHVMPYYIAMEMVSGVTLGWEMKTRSKTGERFSVAEVVHLALGLLEPLAALHPLGIMHRDLTPNNVMLLPSGQLKLIDFGLAKVENEASENTTKGRVLGTPLYRPPELWLGDPQMSPAGDVYMLGVILFELLTLSRAFVFSPDGSHAPIHASVSTSQALEVQDRVLRAIRPSALALRPEIPVELDAVVQRMMAVRPEDRPKSSGELTGLLRAILPEVDESPGLASVSFRSTVVPADKTSGTSDGGDTVLTPGPSAETSMRTPGPVDTVLAHRAVGGRPVGGMLTAASVLLAMVGGYFVRVWTEPGGAVSATSAPLAREGAPSRPDPIVPAAPGLIPRSPARVEDALEAPSSRDAVAPPPVAPVSVARKPPAGGVVRDVKEATAGSPVATTQLDMATDLARTDPKNVQALTQLRDVLLSLNKGTLRDPRIERRVQLAWSARDLAGLEKAAREIKAALTGAESK